MFNLDLGNFGLKLKKGGQEGVKPVLDLEFTTEDGQFLYREKYADGTKSILKPIPGLDSSMSQAFKEKREKMIKEYKEKGLWAGKNELRADN